MWGERMRDADHRVVACRPAERPRPRPRGRVPMERVIRPEKLLHRRPVDRFRAAPEAWCLGVDGGGIGGAMTALAERAPQPLDEAAADAMDRDAVARLQASIAVLPGADDIDAVTF